MDWERLSIYELAQMAALIEKLGTPEAPDKLEELINVCEGAATMYRKALAESRRVARSHNG